jgi:hypothetical protein
MAGAVIVSDMLYGIPSWRYDIQLRRLVTVGIETIARNYVRQSAFPVHCLMKLCLGDVLNYCYLPSHLSRMSKMMSIYSTVDYVLVEIFRYLNNY